MLGLGETLNNFARYRKQFEAMAAGTTLAEDSHLIETSGFGTNPGALVMRSFVPDFLPPRAPLVVVLHGCTQNAASYDLGTGWSKLAREFGFALLFPEQQRSNNPNLCFNWFLAEDTSRDHGEALSIRQMITRMVADHGLDPARIHVTGLSAGGAMTTSLLACYPEVFAAGAIIAGLPHGSARNVQEAFGAMYQGGMRSGEDWGKLVRAASPHTGPWPRVAIWHGSADATVTPGNAVEIVKQWLDVQGLPAEPTSTDTVLGFPHRVWRRGGQAVVEAYSITGMGHGTPIDTKSADRDERCGTPGPHILDVGICSTAFIARSWGLLKKRVGEAAPERKSTAAKRLDVAAVIDKALRAAGLVGRK